MVTYSDHKVIFPFDFDADFCFIICKSSPPRLDPSVRRSTESGGPRSPVLLLTNFLITVVNIFVALHVSACIPKLVKIDSQSQAINISAIGSENVTIYQAK